MLDKNANCQTQVSVTLASGEVPVMLGLRLYLPESSTSDTARMDRADAVKARGICEQTHQQLKEELGFDHFEGAPGRCYLDTHS